MITESFVEDSFVLTPKEVLQNLRNVMEIGPSAYTRPRADIDYWSEDFFDPSVVLVSVGEGEPQRLNLELHDITFGQRGYFRCVCGVRVSKLYLPPNGSKFLCRRCHGLQYELTRINRHSVAGKALYRMNRLRKLADSRASMSRILYDGQYSKRFERFLRLCDRAGYNDIVKGAKDLKTLLQG